MALLRVELAALESGPVGPGRLLLEHGGDGGAEGPALDTRGPQNISDPRRLTFERSGVAGGGGRNSVLSKSFAGLLGCRRRRLSNLVPNRCFIELK